MYWKNTPDYYQYMDSVVINNDRYSLYKENFTFGNGWAIFKHDINYSHYKEVEMSKLSLYVFNNNPNDEYLYYYFPWDISYENAKLEVFYNRYLTLSFDWNYYFLYDWSEDKKYNDRGDKDFSWLAKEEIHNEIVKIIKTQE